MSTEGTGLTPEELRDLLAAWALDAVDDRERAVVERAIAADPELALEARGLLETTALLAGSVAAAPPPALRADVLAAIAREPQQTPSDDDAAAHPGAAAPSTPAPVATPAPTAPASPAQAPTSPSPTAAPHETPAPSPQPRRHGPGRWQRFALAAVVAGALAVPATVAYQTSQRAEQAEQQVAALEQAMREPGATLVQGDVAGGGRAAAVLTDGTAVFTASDLPDPGEGLAYQLWRADGETMVSAGVLSTHDGRVTTTVSADIPVDVLAVSIEPAGGSTAPTTDPIVILAST